MKLVLGNWWLNSRLFMSFRHHFLGSCRNAPEMQFRNTPRI
jgi:hypothetical protein